jgi:flagellin
MRELAVQSSTDTNTQEDRAKPQAEVDQLAHEITRISNTTEFNTRNLLAGGLDTIFHIGANQGQNVNSTIGAMDAFTLGVAVSKIDTTLTAADGVTGINGVTENLGAGAAVTVTVNAASGSVTQGDVKGTIAIADAAAYTGVADTTISFEITAVDGSGAVTQITVGGSAIDVASGGIFDLGQGIEITIETDSSNAAGQVGSVDLTAKNADIQLINDAGDLGAAVTVRGNQTGVIVGDAATNRTAQISFDFDNLVDNAGIAITQTLEESKAAVTDALGNVATGAIVKAGVNISTQAAADKAITTINNALELVSEERSKLGAMQNRLEHTIKNLDTSSENLQASEARIRDVDMAKEMMEFTKNSILQQAATAMLAQANQQPQSVLQLLR